MFTFDSYSSKTSKSSKSSKSLGRLLDSVRRNDLDQTRRLLIHGCLDLVADNHMVMNAVSSPEMKMLLQQYGCFIDHNER